MPERRPRQLNKRGLVQTTVELKPEIISGLEELAKRDGELMASEIRVALKFYLLTRSRAREQGKDGNGYFSTEDTTFFI